MPERAGTAGADGAGADAAGAARAGAAGAGAPLDGAMLADVTASAREAVTELLALAGLEPGDLLVIGGSTSEVAGRRIGTGGSLEIADALLDGLLPPLAAAGIYPVVQCCEHLNRALVMPREAAAAHRLERVTVLPAPEAGGALATAAYRRLPDAVVTERVLAGAGLDIGETLIGMHLRPVAVPVRLSHRHIGAARLNAARTRPKLIGGPRAHYPEAQYRPSGAAAVTGED